jgi:hypothetical protein
MAKSEDLRDDAEQVSAIRTEQFFDGGKSRILASLGTTRLFI